MNRRRTFGLVLVLGGIPCWVAGCGRGGEWQFSPETFEHRGAGYYFVPFTGLIVWSRGGQPYRHRMVQFWVDEGYLMPATQARQWDVITGWVSWERLNYSGVAKSFWYKTGCRTDEQAEQWVAWSQRHPSWAELVWPRVVGLIRRSSGNGEEKVGYHVAAYLMMRVKDVADDVAFKHEVGEWEREFADFLQRELA